MIYIHVIYLVKGMNDLIESIQWQTQGKHEGLFQTFALPQSLLVNTIPPTPFNYPSKTPN